MTRGLEFDALGGRFRVADHVVKEHIGGAEGIDDGFPDRALNRFC